MRAFQISALDGPDALELTERPEPEPSHFMSPGAGVVIDVQAAGAAFPDLLMSRGLYQMKPDWTKAHREDVRAAIRVAVKRALVARGVKPEDFDLIIARVMENAETVYGAWPMMPLAS